MSCILSPVIPAKAGTHHSKIAIKLSDLRAIQR